MPRRKDQGWKPPGSRALEEVKNVEREMRVSKLDRELSLLLPDADLGPRLLPKLHEFRQQLDDEPRAAVTLTLALSSLSTLSWLEKELVMKRGKVLDWLLMGFKAKHRQDLKRQKDEKRDKARKDRALHPDYDPDDDPDPDDEDDEDES